MYNEILRKITSLSLLAILLTSSSVFVLPNAVPAAHAQTSSNPNLFVSAENSAYNNYFSGPQVVQVVISDPDINRIDTAYGEPQVTVNGNPLRMAQTTDGNWYGYFADRHEAMLADATQPASATAFTGANATQATAASAHGLKFGQFCSPSSSTASAFISTGDFSNTKGFVVAGNGTTGAKEGAAAITAGFAGGACTAYSDLPGGNTHAYRLNDVVRQNKTLTPATTSTTTANVKYGQIGIKSSSAWPIIQLYDFTPPTTVTVQYVKAGTTQTVSLNYDRMPQNLITSSLDQTQYPGNAQVFVTIRDQSLNIDPTDQDNWTFGTNSSNSTVFYELFDKNGNRGGLPGRSSTAFSVQPTSGGASSGSDGTIGGAQNLAGNLTNLYFNHNGFLTLNQVAQSNPVTILNPIMAKQKITDLGKTTTTGSVELFRTQSLKNAQPVTFFEQGGINTGVFGNWDGTSTSDLITINNNNIRGQSAVLSYNQVGLSVVGGFAFGSISLSPVNGTWPSGQKIPFTLTDMNSNKNSKIAEHLDVDLATAALIPAMTIGTPFTLQGLSASGITTGSDVAKLYTQVIVTKLAGKGAEDKITFTASPTEGTTNNGNVVPTTILLNGTSAACAGTFSSSGYAKGGFCVDDFSQRAILNPSYTNAQQVSGGSTNLGKSLTIAASGLTTTANSPTPAADAIVFALGNRTIGTLENTVNNNLGNTAGKFRGVNMFNYDLRSLTDSRINGTGTAAISSGEWFLLINRTATTSGATTFGLSNGGTAATCNFEQLMVASCTYMQSNLIAVPLANVTSLQGLVDLDSSASQAVTNSNATNTAVTNGTAFAAEVFKGSKPGQAIGLMFLITAGSGALDDNLKPVVADFFSFGLTGDGTTEAQRVNNAIYRWEPQETGGNTGIFTGTGEYTMLNQLNILNINTYNAIRPISYQVKFIAHEDLTAADGRAVKINYNDFGADGQYTFISAQQDVPTHTGVVSFDSKTYALAATVTVTLNDPDLNVNNDLVDVYSTVGDPAAGTGIIGITAGGTADPASDTVGVSGIGQYSNGAAFGRLLDIQFGQNNTRWVNNCFFNVPGNPASGLAGSTPSLQGASTSLAASGFSLVETGPSTGIFKGTFEIPDQFCLGGSTTSTGVGGASITNTIGQNMKVNYVDFRDESGKTIEVSDNAGVTGSTGSIKLDRAVYPVPFGAVADFGGSIASSTPGTDSVYPLHRDTIPTGGPITSTNSLTAGDVRIHIRVNDPDLDITSGVNLMSVGHFGTNSDHGLVKVTVQRQSSIMTLATAGGPNTLNGRIFNGDADKGNSTSGITSAKAYSLVPELGPMTETGPASGIFQKDMTIRFTDGPADSACPVPTTYTALNGTSGGLGSQFVRFTAGASTGTSYCIKQGDVLTVQYTDLNDASGHTQTITDSSTFDLRNGVLQSDKSVYIIGSDMILTLVEPDLNLDSQAAETVPLDVIEWDSHAAKITMGPLSGASTIALAGATGAANFAAFNAKPTTFVETGKDTGIFQTVIKIPKSLSNTLLERGEQIHLEYNDWGPAGAKTVGSNEQDVELTIYTSNFGATVELDQKVYTWTDRVYITIVAPDHNFDPNLIDVIGDSDLNKVTVSTRGHQLSPYKLVETGVDTGIFTGYVILTGDPNIKPTTGSGSTLGGGVDGAGSNPTGSGPSGTGPTDGFLPAEDQDGVSVSFEFTRDQTVTGSALIRWNIGQIKWLEASYPANGQGVLQIVDPDMNLNPKAVDKFDTNVWSDSDSGGIKLTMTETGQDTGIFQGTVYFTTNFQSSGNRLHVAEGDTVTGEYRDRTLPPPYTSADELRITSTTFIGTVVPPLERAPATNPRIVDSLGNALTSVKVNQQIQVTADLTNGQDRDQPFAYLVQIQDANGVTVSLSWITGTLTSGQSLNPSQSWTPTAAGTYTAQIFVWQSIDNPNALSPPLSTTITVS